MNGEKILIVIPTYNEASIIEKLILEIQNNFEVLDLGCGTGIIGVAIMKSFSNLKMYCSDLDEKSVKLTKQNFKQHKLKADNRSGNLFTPWERKKFDYIVNEVSGI